MEYNSDQITPSSCQTDSASRLIFSPRLSRAVFWRIIDSGQTSNLIEQQMLQLIRIPFSEDLHPKVQQFDCGTNIWEVEVSTWIKAPRGRGGAIDEMENGGLSVWLYATAEGELVGFGSLGESDQRWPKDKDPPIKTSAIPFMGVDCRFWGKPPGNWEERYSAQILRNLIDEAMKFKDTRKLLKLLVCEHNIGAIKLYERIGFKEFHKPRKDIENGLLYKRMAISLI